MTTTTTVAAQSGYFSTLAPGSVLPSDATCASRVRRVPEQRSDNALANATVPPAGSFTLAPLGQQNGYDGRTQTLEARVTGGFTGTTDEIIQWAACKWGFDENVVRAIAVVESDWHQSQLGDYTSDASLCPAGYAPSCPRSFGIHQVTWESDPIGTFSWSQKSTAFNLDASLLVHRICYEGYMQWLKNIGYTSYTSGDLWGCVGQWYSGNWHDSGAQTYISEVKGYVNAQPWTQDSFSNVRTVLALSSHGYDFEGGSTQGWAPTGGPVTVATTASPVHSGSGALAIKLSPTGADWPAVQVSSPPGLAPGTQVTYWVHQPSGSTLTSVQPYIANLEWNDVYAPAVVLATGWNKVVWSVPAADGIKGMGLKINDGSGWSGRLVLDSVTW
jgi:autotransporter family porin